MCCKFTNSFSHVFEQIKFLNYLLVDFLKNWEALHLNEIVNLEPQQSYQTGKREDLRERGFLIDKATSSNFSTLSEDFCQSEQK